MSFHKLLETNDCAVIVIDKQRGYLFPEGKVAEVLGRNDEALKQKIQAIDTFVNQARNFHIPIIWTKMVENVDESPSNLVQQMKNGILPHMINSYDQTFEIVGDQPKPIDKVIVKHRYDAFVGTDLDEYLKSKHIKTVVLVGFFTSRCVLSTAIVAGDIGYNVFAPVDLTDVSPNRHEELQVALNVIATLVGYTPQSSEILQVWHNK